MKIVNTAMKWIFETVLRKKLGLKKSKPGEKIKWYESETILSGIIVSMVGTYELIAMIGRSNFGLELPDIPVSVKAWLGSILGGTIVWGRWTSEKNIE